MQLRKWMRCIGCILEAEIMNNDCNEFSMLISEETKQASARFIEKIKSGKLRKRTVPNHSTLKFSEEKALERFKIIVQDKSFEQAISETYGKFE